MHTYIIQSSDSSLYFRITFLSSSIKPVSDKVSEPVMIFIEVQFTPNTDMGQLTNKCTITINNTTYIHSTHNIHTVNQKSFTFHWISFIRM